jgi:hypothetical protein
VTLAEQLKNNLTSKIKGGKGQAGGVLHFSRAGSQNTALALQTRWGSVRSVVQLLR